jgi:hypothetical protein
MREILAKFDTSNHFELMHRFGGDYHVNDFFEKDKFVKTYVACSNAVLADHFKKKLRHPALSIPMSTCTYHGPTATSQQFQYAQRVYDSQ